jgi:hypothetical protein
MNDIDMMMESVLYFRNRLDGILFWKRFENDMGRLTYGYRTGGVGDRRNHYAREIRTARARMRSAERMMKICARGEMADTLA